MPIEDGSTENGTAEDGPVENGLVENESAEDGPTDSNLRAGRSRRREPSPSQRALALLVRREHSRQELDRKLRARGVTPEDAAAAIQRMCEAGWQDDGRFAASLARSRAGSGYGPLRIRAELGCHHLDDTVIAAAFAALAEAGEDDWAARATDLVRRRFGAGTLDAKQRRKAADLLLRRGFDGDSMRVALRGGTGED